MTGPDRVDGLPDPAVLLAMSAVPGVGPVAMSEALAGRSPRRAWAHLCAEAVERGQPITVDPVEVWERHLAADVTVLTADHPRWPADLVVDPDPPFVLVCRGDLAALEWRRAGVVGTRRASQYGLGVARELGRHLAGRGVTVVSGLALGIDGAAHDGLLGVEGVPPIGVVAGGLDLPYPPRHRGLWATVAERGLLISEAPLGTRPDRWRFPARNRIIAALSEVVVVVESQTRGGSLYTAGFALDRGRPLVAVPGPVTSAAARGTNRLIADGAIPYCEPADVLLALGIDPDAGQPVSARPAAPGGNPGRVLDATRHEVVTLETLVARTRLTLPEVAAAIQELCATGWLSDLGGHYEPRSPDPGG